MEQFTKLGLSKGLTDILKQFGFKEPSEIQEKAIPLALAGKDIIGGSATGSGKTLAFASTILENLKPNQDIQALILTPTRELSQQVANSIRDFGKNKKLNILAIYGGVPIDNQTRKFHSADVVVGTPGRILDHLNRRTLRLDKVKFLILDEVDRMFDMGFRRDVEKIINECPKQRQTIMVSATISGDIDYLAKKYTKNAVKVSVNSYIDPSKLKQIYYDVPDYKKFSLLVSLLKKEDGDLVMVFCNTRKNVDFVADNLIRAGIPAKSIHGGLDQRKRIRVLEEFHKKGVGVLVCTDVAARGLDIKGVSHVYNYDIPTDPKDYIHRIGRTARAGKEGKAIIVLSSRDYQNFQILTMKEDFNVTAEDLPEIEMIKINTNSPQENNFNRKGNFRNNSKRNFGGSSRNGNRLKRGNKKSFRKGSDSKNSGKSFGKKRFGRKESRRRF